MVIWLDEVDYDYDVLLDVSVGCQFVLFGEVIYGICEFYWMCVDIICWLIVEQGFDVVVVEVDWFDVWYLYDYVGGGSELLVWVFDVFE